MSDKQDITFEEVKVAKDALEAGGKRATVRAMREQLGGRGSSTTIVKMMRKLRGGAAVPSDEPALPKEIVEPLHAALRKALGIARSEIQEQALRQVAEARAAADLDVEEAAVACDEATNRLAERDQRIASLVAEVSTLRSELSSARESLAAANARVEASDKSHALELSRSEKLMGQVLALTDRLSAASAGKKTGRMNDHE